MTPEVLAACLACPRDRAALWLPELMEAMGRADCLSLKRKAAFLAQIGHESGGISRLEENLNYSAEALVRIWPRRFDAKIAVTYARQPERIANRVYADRMGNGPEDSGDGWRFRGRGLIQITGRTNYETFGTWLNENLVAFPERLIQIQPACLSAAWFWLARGLNDLADKDDFLTLTKRINGGTNGLEDRTLRWTNAKIALGIV